MNTQEKSNKGKEEAKFSLSGSFQKTKEYLDTKLKIMQLKVTERSSRLIASLLVDVVKTIFAVFVVFFLSLALGFYLSEVLDSFSLGFLATGGIFVLLIGVILLVEPKLERFLMNQSIK
ncbi:MAG TPA: phage holin family protein, partial [Sphingobacteriaceae bacterium]|nr:phage holin family protein [Sphingobacteriaceae bacterium]